jgi:GT2 family glycosyltransferase
LYCYTDTHGRPETIVPLVSVIIVNWNGEEFLRDCLSALGNQTFRDFEVIFVDNGSADRSVTAADRLFNELSLSARIVRLTTNTGFTGGNIEGLRHCAGKYIALLNNDTVASEGWLAALVAAMDRHPETGMCASKLIVAGTNVIDSAGDGLLTSLRAFKRGEGLPSGAYAAEEYAFGACGGAAFYRRSMLDDIGFLDEDLFLYFEDADLSFRAQLRGWKCLFVPAAVVYHKVGGSRGTMGENAAFYGVRNDKIVTLKNVPALLMLVHLPTYLLAEVASILYHIRIGRFKSYLRGNCEFLQHLPYYFKKRKRIMQLRRVSSRYINSELTGLLPFWAGKIRMFFSAKKRRT